MNLWITAADEQRRVIFNQVIDFESVGDAREYAERLVPAEHHGSICITDEDNNPVLDRAVA